jgi:hypothetical protein
MMTIMYNFMADLISIGQNLFKGPLYPSMSTKVEFYTFMKKIGCRCLFLLLPLGAYGIRETLRFTSVS